MKCLKLMSEKKMGDAKLKWRGLQSEIGPLLNVENMFGGEENSFANIFWSTWPYTIIKTCQKYLYNKSKIGMPIYFK